MLKVYLSLIVSSVFFYSCAKEEIGVPKAVKELITNNSNCTCDPYINKYLWRDKIIYVLATRGPACNGIPTYFDENGAAFNMAIGYNFDSFLQEGHFMSNIWTCNQ